MWIFVTILIENIWRMVLSAEENLVDEFTKNVSGYLYDARAYEYMSDKKALLENETLCDITG
jgi:hypothetical protein